MSDKIILRNMMFYGFHGVYEYEREQGQKFYLDAEIYTDLTKAGVTDDLSATIDYTQVYNKIKDIAENNRFYLLEALASNIAAMILSDFGAKQVTVRVRKPAVPIAGYIDYVEVEVTRSK